MIESLRNLNLHFQEVNSRERRIVGKRWLECFADIVKAETGNWVYMGFRWHGFSWGFQSCMKGHKALATYIATKAESVYIFDEKLKHCVKCQPILLPDLSHLNADLYVVSEDFSWTMAFTHEFPDCGPFFAYADHVP